MAVDDTLQEALEAFIEEARELLESSESILLDLESDLTRTELVGELFRYIHTIKGSAGIFGYHEVVGFTHEAENLMGKIRDGDLALSSSLVATMLTARDHISTLVEAAIAGEPIDDMAREHEKKIIDDIRSYLGLPNEGDESDKSEEHVVLDGSETENKENHSTSDSGSPTINDCWHLSVRFDASVLRNGMEPIAFFTYLKKLGEIVSMTTLTDNLPEFFSLEPEFCYLGFELDLRSDASKQDIADVFEFVKDDCTLHILPPNTLVSRYRKLIDELPEENLKIGEILVNAGALTREELAEALNMQLNLQLAAEYGPNPSSSAAPELGKIAVDNGMVSEPILEAALTKQNSNRSLSLKNSKNNIKIDSERLSHLINLVGELVIANANITTQARYSANSGLLVSSENLARLVNEVREVCLSLRMVQIGETFNRYKRVVRDLCKDNGKSVDLIIEGGETELDKSIVEKITDPILHMVRNAVDHGVESKQERVQACKNETAQLKLRAHHESGAIIIHIADDGRGLDPEKLEKKAKAKGLISDSDSLSEREIFRLIFSPGFSTAEQVSNVSGRGVGMDVVRKNIDELRGQIDIHSELGKGTEFIIRLPLTLAIIDGFHVMVGDASFIIPLTNVEECIELSETPHQVDKKGDYINLRGYVLPFLRLGQVFGEAINDKNNLKRNNIVVVTCAGKRIGLVVDDLLGEQQSVVKPLGKIFNQLKCISGATILGDGNVAMIIDVGQLLKYFENREQKEGNEHVFF